MLNNKELSAIRKALPANGYPLVAERCNKSTDLVGKILREPKRYDPVVIEAAFEVIAEYKALVEAQKHRVKNLTTSK